MNKNQWFVLGIVLFIFGVWLLKYALDCSLRNNSINAGIKSGVDTELIKVDALLLIACHIRRYSLSIPALFSIVFGFIFFIMGWLEFKKELRR